jgi:hypothetical protein
MALLALPGHATHVLDPCWRCVPGADGPMCRKHQREVISGNVHMPAAPETVLVETLPYRYVTVHDLGDDPGYTRCELAIWPFWSVPVADLLDLDPHWCDGCWPGYRCQVCHRPSGESVECQRCALDSIDADKRIEAAA